MKNFCTFVCFCLCFCFLSAGEGDAKPVPNNETKSQASDPAPSPSPAAVMGGSVVTLTESRSPSSTPELSPEIEAALREMVIMSDEGLTSVTTADGTVLVDLQGRFQSAAVVSIGADGKLKSQCYSAPPGEGEAGKEKKPQQKQ